jgi:hypothetical protein
MNLHTSYSWRRFAMIIGSCSCYSPNGPCPGLISPVFSHVWWAPDTKIELRSEWICGYVFCLPFSTIFVPNRRRSCQFSFHRTLGLLVKNDANMDGSVKRSGAAEGFVSCCLRGHPKQKKLNSPTSSLYQGDLPHLMLLYNSCFRRQLEQPIGLLTSQLEYFNNIPIVSHPPTHKK